jgi:hypothetical protein
MLPEFSLQALEAVERYADRVVTDEHLTSFFDAEIPTRAPLFDTPGSPQAVVAVTELGTRWRYFRPVPGRFHRVRESASDATSAVYPVARSAAEALAKVLDWEEARGSQAPLIRDILGNPFRPITIDPVWTAWNDQTVPRIAQAIYADRTFDHLPILADALEDAGCSDADILAHCRGPGPHVRGCWVVDLLLGKT